jgi:hypothetical protein
MPWQRQDFCHLTWETMGKSIGKSWDNHGKIIGKSWERTTRNGRFVLYGEIIEELAG